MHQPAPRTPPPPPPRECKTTKANWIKVVVQQPLKTKVWWDSVHWHTMKIYIQMIYSPFFIILIFFYLTFQCWGYFCPKQKDANIFEIHGNPVMLVFIGKLLLSTLRCVPMCQGFSHFSGFLHHFLLAKVATSSIRVNSAQQCSLMSYSLFFTGPPS